MFYCIDASYFILVGAGVGNGIKPRVCVVAGSKGVNVVFRKKTVDTIGAVILWSL